MIRKDIRVENSAWLVSFNICWKIVNLNKQYDNMVFEASPDKKQLNAHNKFIEAVHQRIGLKELERGIAA